MRDGAKVGLVGSNGAGKSSLLRILAGFEEPDAGEVVLARDARLGYVGQSLPDDPQTTLRVLLESAFAHMRAEEERMRELEAELSAAAESGDGALQEKALQAYGNARESFDRHGGEGLERRMRSMLPAIVIAEADRFPEIGRACFDRGFDRSLVILGEAMRRLAGRGLLRNLSDPTLAAYQFAGLVMYQPMNHVMFAGTDAVPPPDMLNRIADSAVEMFLAVYG